jgi:hypothetical protein
MISLSENEMIIQNITEEKKYYNKNKNKNLSTFL